MSQPMVVVVAITVVAAATQPASASGIMLHDRLPTGVAAPSLVTGDVMEVGGVAASGVAANRTGIYVAALERAMLGGGAPGLVRNDADGMTGGVKADGTAATVESNVSMGGVSLRALGVDQLPPYLASHTWPGHVTGVSTFNGVPLDKRCRRLPVQSRQHRIQCQTLDSRRDDQTQPVLPTLFMPGFPKSATTWLFECMRTAFVPERICQNLPVQLGVFPLVRGFSPTLWNTTNCRGRRFMLPGISCAITGGCWRNKEYFFYGSGTPSFRGLSMLHGPEVATELVPLDLFRAKELRPVKMRNSDWIRHRVKRYENFCLDSNYTHLPQGQLHPACCVAFASNPMRPSCRWHETVRIKLGVDNATWLKTALPWVVPSQFNFATIDFTPNYLCSQACTECCAPQRSALKKIYDTSRDPLSIRFIVLMRDPIMRAFSEWSMFRLHWRWDREKSLQTAFKRRMLLFQNCNSTLFSHPELLYSLPELELQHYISRCFKGMAMDYMASSIYSVCILGALRIFKRDQFLFLRFEDMMRMKVDALVQLISNFTGLYTDRRIIKQLKGERACEAASARRKPQSFTSSFKRGANDPQWAHNVKQARDELRQLIPELERFFHPYNEMLAHMIHPDFRWGTDTHTIT